MHHDRILIELMTTYRARNSFRPVVSYISIYSAANVLSCPHAPLEYPSLTFNNINSELVTGERTKVVRFEFVAPASGPRK